MSFEAVRVPELERLREEIERIDRTLVGLIADRVSVAGQIGVVKRSRGLPTLDPAQEAAVIRRAGELARGLDLEVEAVRNLFWQVVALTRKPELER